MLGCSKRNMNFPNATYPQEELGRKSISVFEYQVGQRIVWEDPVSDEVDEGWSDFARGYSLQLDSAHLVVVLIDDD